MWYDTGLYYPPNSAKTRHCIRGRDLLYSYCTTHSIPYQQTGKLVVAKQGQEGYIEALHAKAVKLEWSHHRDRDGGVAVPTQLISGAEARAMEPALSKEIVAALYSPQTGIIDSHALMSSLESSILESEGGEIVYNTSLVRIDRGHSGWVVQLLTHADHGGTEKAKETETETDCILASTVINAGGLSAPTILNSILPPSDQYTAYFARGSYASYSGALSTPVQRLIYPCHETGKGTAFQSLGTHLTLDMQGRIKFGPDLQWISPPVDEDEDPEFWEKHLIPDEGRLEEMHREVASYLPEVRRDKMNPDYVGIRPKIGGPSSGFVDFTFRTDEFALADKTRGGGKMISLLGIESPGLTSALSIAEEVVERMV